MRALIPVILLSIVTFSFQIDSGQKDIRYLKYNEKEVKTTFQVDSIFYGKYQGRKKGYLQLDEDGSGSYMYDYQAFLPENCQEGEITFDWGFILDESGKIVKFERSYGYSYPIIYSCNGPNSFQGCTKTSLVDYILVYQDGTLTVSSSDDWKKVK